MQLICADDANLKETMPFDDPREEGENLTIDQAVETWAPPKNAKGQVINDTARYQKQVREAVGVTGETKISTLTPQQFETLKQAMARVEGFYESRPNRKVKVVTQPAKPRMANPKK